MTSFSFIFPNHALLLLLLLLLVLLMISVPVPSPSTRKILQANQLLLVPRSMPVLRIVLARALVFFVHAASQMAEAEA